MAKVAAPWLTQEQVEAMWQDVLAHREQQDEKGLNRGRPDLDT